MSDLAIFAPHAGCEFGQRVSACLGVVLAKHEERNFEDGEHKTRPLESVRGKDVFVVQSLYGDATQSVNDKLCRFLFFLGALRDASAARVTAVVPYLCYARKDRRSKPRDPITTRYIAAMFEAAGIERMVTLDVHNLAAFENAFRVPTDHLEAKRLFVEHFAALVKEDNVVVVSPDVGGIKRAEAFREAMSRKLGRTVGIAFVEKYRSAGVVSGEALVGDVAGKSAIIIDDLISSGTTLARAAKACSAHKAALVFAAATHGVFASDASRVLTGASLETVAVTNTIPPFRLSAELVQSKLVVIDVAPLVAEAIKRIHGGGSLTELLD